MQKTISGRTVVFGMFGFAIVMTAILWLYWDAYTAPFRPLQYAINDAFPGSGPRVVGGKQKKHKHEYPEILRIVIRVDFDPNEASEKQVEPYTSKLLELAKEHVDLTEYEQVEIHLMHRVPESETELKKFEFPTADL
ncbi:MAG: hypothetical protein KDA52_14725 [Planctomycetaceae bacterium]|nr:hypothetical protein [Planctomycetaceae bacterium]